MNEFLDSPVEGCCAIVSVPEGVNVNRIFNHYQACKSICPQRTSAYIGVPVSSLPTPATKRMQHVCTIDANEQQNTVATALFYDPPAFPTGVHVASTLPHDVQNLRIPDNGNDDGLTFVFNAELNGAKCTVLGDTGAKYTFISKAFALRNKLWIDRAKIPIILADGSQSVTAGVVHSHLTLQSYSDRIRMYVIDMTPGFDIILGDDWYKQEHAVIDFGSPEPGPRFEPPSVWLRRRNMRLFPDTDVAAKPSKTQIKQKRSEAAVLISAVQAKRLLSRPSRGSASPFMIILREAKDAGFDQREQVKTVVDNYSDVFEDPVVGEWQEGTPEGLRLHDGVSPPNRPAFRLSISERQEVEKQVESLLASKRIVPSSSAYGAPVLFAPKPDGTWRMCIDYRELNKITHKNKYPIPRVEDLLDNLSGAKCFSSIDLTSGYHQIPLHPKDWEKTAFNTHIGKFEWRVLPFGLCNAPAVFQATMNKIFSPYLNKFVCVYLDDILIYSKNEEEHMRHIQLVLEVLRKHGYKARLTKCEFFKQELRFLGHILSAEGIKPDPAKVSVVKDWPTPRSVYEVRSFLGLANYFRRYIKGYARIACPLTDLLKGIDASDRKGRLLQWGKLSDEEARKVEKAFSGKWTQQCADAFATLKSALVTAPVLALPDFEKPFTVVVDACSAAPAVGGALLQEGHPIAYYSRKLTGTEAGYSASDIEMLAVIYALREWRCYLEGSATPFTIVTDHQPNTYVDTSVNPHTLKRRARWLYESSAYNYVWQYRPGASNVADPLSRSPSHFAVIQHGQCVHRLGMAAPVAARTTTCAYILGAVREARTSARGGRRKRKQQKLAQSESDKSARLSDIQTVRGYVVRDLFSRCQQGCEQMLREGTDIFGNLKLIRREDGLYWTENGQLYVPDVGTLRSECVDAVHSNTHSGHYGVTRTAQRAKQVFYWENMIRDVAEFVRRCDSCQRVKASTLKPQGLLNPLPIPGRRWESVSMDLITDLPVTERGHDTIVVFVDRLSKMVHLAPSTKTVTAEGLVELFEQHVFRLHGLPNDIVSDRDVRVQSEFWKLICDQFGIIHNQTSSHHPQSDGQTENANGVLEDTLRHFVNQESQRDWDALLPVAEFAMNSAYNTTIKNTPFMLNYGQNPDTPITLYMRGANPDVNRFVGKWSAQLQTAKQCIAAAQSRQKAMADRRRRPAEQLDVGDEVLINVKHFRLDPGLKLKLAPRWMGPFKITEVVGTHKLSYRVHLPAPWHQKHNVFHVSSLKKYHSDGTYQPPAVPPLQGDTIEWKVERISDTRSEPRRQYLVHWVGGGHGWLDVVRLLQCETLIREFWQKRQQTPPDDAFPMSHERVSNLLEGKQA